MVDWYVVGEASCSCMSIMYRDSTGKCRALWSLMGSLGQKRHHELTRGSQIKTLKLPF